MNFKPFCSTEIVFCDKENMKKQLFSLDAVNIVMVMSESSSLRWDMCSFIESFRAKCESFTWIKEVAPNPTQKDIITSLRQIGSRDVDIIIVFGGGSGIDLAKGISAFYNKEKNDIYTIDEITYSINSKDYLSNKFIDIIAVPSTAGTGSEVTQWATIWDDMKAGKLSIDAPMLKPRMAIIVPELTLSMSATMTLSTGLDAMCQAIEAYWSVHTTPIVQEIAYQAVKIITQNLRKAVEKPNDIMIREKLCRASVLAGLAFSQTRTTACHSISYPLTMLFGVPHGLAVAVTLDAVARINRGHFSNDEELFDLFNQFGSIQNFIDTSCVGIVDLRLSAFNIKQEDIPCIVDNAFTLGRMNNNPVNLNKDDVASILKSILSD